MAENTSSLRINVNDLLSLQGVEKQRVEFKAAWNADKKHNRGTYWQVVHSICAFANDFYNDNGGYIIIGVEEKENWDNPDDRQIILPPRGVPARILETTQKEIMGACRANIKPDYCPILSPELVEGKHVLVVWATASDNSPHQCRESNQGPENHYYVRKATETKKASPDEIKHLIEQHSKIPFDDRKASDYVTGRQLSEDDIDVKLVRKFLEDVGSNHRDQNHDNLSLLYQSLKLVRSIGDKKVGERLLPILVPRNVALLFFSPEPEKYLRGAQSEIATYNHDNDPVDDNPVRGPIDQQIEAILSYISDEKKEEVPYTFVPYPMRALREAVVNAFYHRGYEPDQCEPVKIHIYPNYIDIISYPGPHPSLKLEYFKEGQEIPPVQARNRRIGELLKERKLAEARGSGVRTIFRTMKQNKSPTPSFMFDSTYFRVRLPGHPKHVAHAVNNKVDNLCAKGEKESAVELLTTFLKENPNMISEFLLGKLLELHDNNKRHPNVQPYEQYISERLERRRPLITELCKWSVSDGTVDITAGVKIVKKLVDEGATCDDLQSATKKAVDFLNERSDDGKQVLEKVQNAHKLFEAMGEVNQTDPYVAYQFACCKFNLYLLNTKGLPDRKKKEFVCLLKDAEDFIQKASQLTSKEHKNHLASQNRQRGYIHFLLLLVKKSTVKEVVDCYDKAKECNPGIRINQFYIPLEYRTRFMESQ